MPEKYTVTKYLSFSRRNSSFTPSSLWKSEGVSWSLTPSRCWALRSAQFWFVVTVTQCQESGVRFFVLQIAGYLIMTGDLLLCHRYCERTVIHGSNPLQRKLILCLSLVSELSFLWSLIRAHDHRLGLELGSSGKFKASPSGSTSSEPQPPGRTSGSILLTLVNTTWRYLETRGSNWLLTWRERSNKLLW